MRAFNTLTFKGQTQRLKKLALAALKKYPFQARKLSLLQADRNAVFRVDTHDGDKYVIHVADPVFDLSETRSALWWLSALVNESAVSVPEPIRNIDGDLLTLQAIEGVPEARICTVISWVKGLELGMSATLDDVYEWAKVIAQLHQHGAQYTPPDGFTRMTYHDVLPFPTDELVIFNDDWQPLINSTTRRTIFERALEQSNKAIHRLYQQEISPQILHGDLHVWNVLRYHTTYSIIDFEDVMWGYPVQDIGTTLYYARHQPNYHDIRAAFKAGYTTITEWIETDNGNIDSMIVARFLNLYNMRLQYANPKHYADYEQFTADNETQLRHYIETGSIRP